MSPFQQYYESENIRTKWTYQCVTMYLCCFATVTTFIGRLLLVRIPPGQAVALFLLISSKLQPFEGSNAGSMP